MIGTVAVRFLFGYSTNKKCLILRVTPLIQIRWSAKRTNLMTEEGTNMVFARFALKVVVSLWLLVFIRSGGFVTHPLDIHGAT
jgi:hypothetical protein